jgi:hypothetical protein
MFHVNRYQMLEVMRAMRMERIFRDRTNPLEIKNISDNIPIRYSFKYEYQRY